MAGTWQGLTHQPAFIPSTMILLTDGRIMVKEVDEVYPFKWHALTPDVYGSYLHGTWSRLADMNPFPYGAREFFASAVLMDGSVLVCCGGNNGVSDMADNCQKYDPVNNSWSLPGAIPSPDGWMQVGGSPCVVFPNGKVMLGNIEDFEFGQGSCAILIPIATIGQRRLIRPFLQTRKHGYSFQVDRCSR